MGLGFKGGFAAFVDGATKGADRTRQIERQEAEDAWVKSQRDTTLEKQNEEKQQRREIKADSAPAKVEQGAGGAIKSEAMDNRDVGLPENEALPNGGLSPQAFSVQGKSYDSQAEADAAAKTYDDGRGARVASRLYQQGRPDAAMALESNQLTLLDKQRAEAKAVMEEGAEESARAARTGDGSLFAQTFNKQGKFKIGGDPVVKEEVRDIPNMGRVKTYNYTVDLVGPDGVKTQKTFNSHDLSMQTLKFKELLSQGRSAEAAAAKEAYQQATIDVKNRDSDARMKAAEAAELRASQGGGKAGKAQDPFKEANDAWELANKGDAKLPPDVLVRGARLTQQLSSDPNKKIPAAMAAEVALDVLTKPELIEPSIDAYGKIHGVYKHPTQGDFVINHNIASADNPGRFKPDQMKAMTEQYLSTLPVADAQQMRSAAVDPRARTTLMNNINAKIDQDIALQIEKTPAAAAALRAQGDAYKAATAKSLTEKLKLVSKYTEPEREKGRLSVGGMPNWLGGQGGGVRQDAPAVDSMGNPTGF